VFPGRKRAFLMSEKIRGKNVGYNRLSISGGRGKTSKSLEKEGGGILSGGRSSNNQEKDGAGKGKGIWVCRGEKGPFPKKKGKGV